MGSRLVKASLCLSSTRLAPSRTVSAGCWPPPADIRMSVYTPSIIIVVGVAVALAQVDSKITTDPHRNGIGFLAGDPMMNKRPTLLNLAVINETITLTCDCKIKTYLVTVNIVFVCMCLHPVCIIMEAGFRYSY